MSDSTLGSLVPLRYILQLNPLKYDQIIVFDWLEVEIEPAAETRLPLLAELHGHRNREVYEYIIATRGDWAFQYAGTDAAHAKPIINVRFSGGHADYGGLPCH
jgi:hypothetical protein